MGLSYRLSYRVNRVIIQVVVIMVVIMIMIMIMMVSVVTSMEVEFFFLELPCCVHFLFCDPSFLLLKFIYGLDPLGG